MDISEIQSDLETIEKNASLLEEANFDDRVDALDYIDFHIINRIEGLLQKINQSEELLHIQQHAERLKNKLEKINNDLFRRLRKNIQMGVCTGMALRDMINKYVKSNNQLSGEMGYNNLDIFIDGLLPIQPSPIETMAREPGMVFYQKTPARIVFELVDKARFTSEDVFYDLGSGLGQVSILVNLLSGVTCKGVEFEPAYCEYAKECAAQLNLDGVEFINADARKADYSKATVFFMYTPFEGLILQEVLGILQKESLSKKIRLFTYGPCTLRVAGQSWLNCVSLNQNKMHELSEFISF